MSTALKKCRPNANVVARRLTTSTLGLGLLEAIPDASISFHADNAPPGLSGRVHMVPSLEDPGGDLRAGRFGWKSQLATVLSFSADAALNEMGFTNRLLMAENDPNGDDPPGLECDTVADPEDGPDTEGEHFIDRVTDFQRLLAAPPQTPRSGMSGEQLFSDIGCADCHVPAFITDDSVQLEAAMRNKVVKPFSDFLLHDMGLLGDGIEQGDAGDREMRTAPLWGLRIRDPLLHDGRVAAGSFESRMIRAVAWHCAFGSSAQDAAARFLNGLDVTGLCPDCPTDCDQATTGGLDAMQRDAVIAFLDSLGRCEFDHDANNRVDLVDFTGTGGNGFVTCFGPGPYSADHPCAISDIDQDGDVDAVDFDFFVTAFDDPIADCNGNGKNDLADIIDGIQQGQSPDANNDGVLDACVGEIPTVSEWGAIVMAMLLLTVGSIVFRSRCTQMQSQVNV